MRSILAFVFAAAILLGCSDDNSAESSALEDSALEDSALDSTAELGRFPDVIAAEAEQTAAGRWRMSVTLSSPYDSASRYADAWRVLGPDDEQLAIRELAHDHAAEQPFTRSLDGIEIAPDIARVTIQGRDLRNGWGGGTFVVELDRDATAADG